MGSDHGDPVANLVSSYKKKIKKVGCCGFWWVFIGVVLLVSGIALLAEFGGYWGCNEKVAADTETTETTDGTVTESTPTDCNVHKMNLAYTGVVFILISIFFVAVGIIFCVAIYIMWQRLDNKDFAKSLFRAPQYNCGDGPYPQQPNGAPCYEGPGYTRLPEAPAEYPSAPHPEQGPDGAAPPQEPSAPPKIGFEGVEPADVKVEVSENSHM